MEIDENKILSNNLKCDICNKMYKTSSGLWKHKKKCFEKDKHIITPEFVIDLIKQNQELSNLLHEKNKTILELSNFEQIG